MTSSSSRGRGRGGRGGGAVGNDSYRRGPSWRGGGGGASSGYGRGGAPGSGTPYVPGSGAAGATGARRMSSSGAAPMRKDDKGKGFQTDMDISAAPRGTDRELKPWTAEDHGPNGSASNGRSTAVPREPDRDILTFGAKPSSIPWDQFKDNERLFGVTTDYDEELYTTKLDRSGPGYKKRERDADRLAAEMMAKPSANPHIAEERGQQTQDTKDEEEKYSGVVRNPNAYVPPGARKGPPAGVPPRKDTPKKEEPAKEVKKDEVKKEEPVKAKEQPIALPLPIVPPTQSVTPPPLGPHRSSADPAVDPAIASLGPGPAATTMTRSTSSVPREQANGSDPKASLPGNVVDHARQFVDLERERAVQHKQTMAKTERANQLAEFKKWQANFKVPLPIPKDILSILSKDEQKQKAIEAKAERERLESHKKQEAAKSPLGSPSKAQSPSPEPPRAGPAQPKKIAMKIPEIPPFRPRVPPAVPVPETASQNIALVTSPTPSHSSIASGAGKLNPKASAFVFKPNANAAVFKPAGSTGVGGDSSAVTSPASQAAKLPAGPSTPTQAPKNPFFPAGPPKRIAVNMRDDFNPFKHGQVATASSVPLSWNYTGRRASVAYNQPVQQMGMMPSPNVGYDGEDPQSPHAQHAPPPMQGMPPNIMQFYGYRPGMLPQMQGMPGMMYPGPGFMPQQMTGGHGPGQGPNMPMYYANGVPPNAHFLPPQMHFQPGPGRPGPGPMYYGQQMPGGPQAPQMQQQMSQMSFQGHPTPPQPHFQQPLPAQGPPGPGPSPGFDGSPSQ